jgi:hypothetical protein
VREITESLVEGVYLFLGKIRRTGDYAFYIGQTINAVGRFVAHRRSFESRLIRINSSRMFMLNEIRGESERLNSESRFIAAAQQLKLPLFNLKLPNLCVHSRNLDSEKQILREALKTLGISPDQMSRRRNRLREAATFSPTEFECARAAEYCDADRKEIERAVREGRLRAVRIGRKPWTPPKEATPEDKVIDAINTLKTVDPQVLEVCESHRQIARAFVEAALASRD